MSSLSSVFFGVPQSRFAAIAILVAVLVVSFVILFGKGTIPMSQKFGFVLLVVLVSLPSLAMSLFQITCLVTGAGLKDQRPWCGWYAWLLSAIMIAYAVLLVASAVMSLVAPKEGFEDGPVSIEGKKNLANKVTAQEFVDMEIPPRPSTPPSENPQGFTVPTDAPPMPTTPPSPFENMNEDMKYSNPPSQFTVNGSRSLPAPAMSPSRGPSSPAPMPAEKFSVFGALI
jgi:membrane protein implicated in regulation of membrane protease activity